jgi:D-glycero-D-manno-heptose 1,7-bisphosphate phosphatase
MSTPAFFLDRDGTINVDHNYVHTQAQWDWCTGAIEAIRWMNQQGFKVIVVTNQSGISRGKYTLAQVEELHAWVDQQLALHQAHVDGWYIAPFHPNYSQGGPWPQEDRKPGTGMFTKAIERFDIDPKGSFMIGDKISDLQPGLSLGMQVGMIKTWHFDQQDPEWLAEHDIPLFEHLGEAVEELSSDLATPFNWNN